MTEKIKCEHKEWLNDSDTGLLYCRDCGMEFLEALREEEKEILRKKQEQDWAKKLGMD